MSGASNVHWMRGACWSVGGRYPELQFQSIQDGLSEGQGQLLPEPEPNVARMPNELAKVGWAVGKLVRTFDSQEPQWDRACTGGC